MNTTFTNGTEYDVLYIPHSSRLSSLPPINIEFQQIITRDFMCHQYLLRKNLDPVLKMSPFFFLQTPSNHFAKLCYLITKDSIESTVNKMNEHMNPIVAFAHFLISGQQSIISIDRRDDPTIIKLYSVAKELMDDGNNLEDKALSALRTVCSATHDQFVKISDTIIEKPNLALQYANAGHLYSDTLKRKYDQMAFSSSSPGKSITPMEESEEINSKSNPQLNLSSEKLIKFVNTYKENYRRMNWDNCWAEGRDIGLFEEYGNGTSLKTVYYRMKKNMNNKLLT
ncbi:unnamed protein product [Cunninghamella blakesleeana]